MPSFLPPLNTVLVLERNGGIDSQCGLPQSCGGKPTCRYFVIPTNLSEDVVGFITREELQTFVNEINHHYQTAHTPSCPLLLINLFLPFASICITGSLHREMNRQIKKSVAKWNKILEKRGIYFEHLRKHVGDHYRSYICFCKNPAARPLPPQPTSNLLGPIEEHHESINSSSGHSGSAKNPLNITSSKKRKPPAGGVSSNDNLSPSKLSGKIKGNGNNRNGVSSQVVVPVIEDDLTFSVVSNVSF
eukprot:gene7996-8818_t